MKALTKDNYELQSIYESSKEDLTSQVDKTPLIKSIKLTIYLIYIIKINELKEKYNECLKVLTRTQEELSSLRKKNVSSKQRNTATLSTSINNMQNVNIESSSVVCDDETIEPIGATSARSRQAKGSSMYSAWIPPNSNSLATEVFCSLAKDFRSKNSNLPQQTSQSSEFVKKVKQKITKRIPGNISDYNMQSDSEIELMMK